MAAQIGVNEQISVNREPSEVAMECNICLDSAFEPVVTLCGHLYCWRCIYKWLQVQESDEEEPQCPICKANISCDTLVPLYGRDDSNSKSRATTEQQDLDLRIPNRPAFRPQNSPSSLPIDSEALALLLSPLTCKFGEMFYARIFGTSEADTQSYQHLQMPSPNPGRGIRQQEKKLEKSLNRLSFFFLCCALLCLFLF